jgi:hypothetical protein
MLRDYIPELNPIMPQQFHQAERSSATINFAEVLKDFGDISRIEKFESGKSHRFILSNNVQYSD